jgi:hypothetical protein
MGIRLKRPKPRFIRRIQKRRSRKKSFGEKRRMNMPATKAVDMFARGPLKDTMIMPRFIFRKYLGSMGTGLAQPKLKRNRQMAPKGSIWGKGFNVRRPIFFAVGSPWAKAARPWAYSCMVMAKRRTGILIIHSLILNDIISVYLLNESFQAYIAINKISSKL